MSRSYTFLCLLLVILLVQGFAQYQGYVGVMLIFMIGACFYAHYYFIGGAHLTFRRKKHQPAARAIAERLIQVKIENPDANHKGRNSILRQVMVDGLNNWGVERRLIYSFRLSLLKELEEHSLTSGAPSIYSWDIDKTIDDIVMYFDKDPTWR